MFRTIKTRLTVTICGILFLVFIIQMAVNFLFTEDFYVYQKMGILISAYHQITEAADDSDSSIEEIIRNLDVDRNLEFFLADEDKNLIYSSRMQNDHDEFIAPKDKVAPDFNFDFDKYPESDYKTSKPTLLKTDVQDGDRIRLLGKIEQGDQTYYLAIRLSVQSLGKEMKSTNLFILFISTFGIIAGSISVYFIAKQFTKPIEDINRVAIHVSNLDFTARAKVKRRKDEIGSLAENINLMSDRLEENIQSLKEANRKLEIDNEYMNRVDEQRKELIANISHELKTPLAILSGYSEMLHNDVPGIDKDFYFETIQDETQKMNILIQNLLNLSTMENKLAELNPEEIDIVGFAERIFRKYSILFANKGVRSEFESQVCGKISADTLYLEEAINNYLANAINYTEKGNLIRMKIEQIEDEAVISVFNEGINIKETHLEKIWNSFYREDKSRSRTSQNNIGLGLYIVRSIMNAHHGKCGATNRENGVEFWLSLKVLS